MSKVSQKALEIVAEAIKAEIRKGNSTWHDTARAVLEAVSSIHEEEPDGWRGVVTDIRDRCSRRPALSGVRTKDEILSRALSNSADLAHIMDQCNSLLHQRRHPAPISKGVTELEAAVRKKVEDEILRSADILRPNELAVSVSAVLDHVFLSHTAGEIE